MKRPLRYQPYPDSKYTGWEAIWEAWGDDMPCPSCGKRQIESQDQTTLCLACHWQATNTVMIANDDESDREELIRLARAIYADDDTQIDEGAEFISTEDGTWVSARVWVPRDKEDEPSWVARHSVNCIICGRLYDERESVADGVDGGEVCPDHEADLKRLADEGIIEPVEE